MADDKTGSILEGVRRAVARPFMRFAAIYWRFARGMTLGVRGLVLTPENRVFLVRHSYVPGWHLPGGGVEVGETLIDALRRELHEEGNIELAGEPALHAVYFNRKLAARDHVALFVIRDFRQERPPDPNAEIVETGFFPCADLPAGVTGSTRQRIAEAVFGAATSPEW